MYRSVFYPAGARLAALVHVYVDMYVETQARVSWGCNWARGWQCVVASGRVTVHQSNDVEPLQFRQASLKVTSWGVGPGAPGLGAKRKAEQSRAQQASSLFTVHVRLKTAKQVIVKDQCSLQCPLQCSLIKQSSAVQLERGGCSNILGVCVLWIAD